MLKTVDVWIIFPSYLIFCACLQALYYGLSQSVICVYMATLGWTWDRDVWWPQAAVILFHRDWWYHSTQMV